MNKKRKKAGSIPGSVVYTGNNKTDKVYIHFLQYDGEELTENTFDSHKGLELVKENAAKVDWYDIRGMHNTELIEVFGKSFNLHPIILENAVDIHNRPKFEEYQNGNFIILKALRFNKDTKTVSKEHIALYFTKSFVITFQETESDVFAGVRSRINNSKGRIRERGTDYLAFSLIDEIVDHYFEVLDSVEEVIEELEDAISTAEELNRKSDIHSLKKELLVLRKAISPLREAISRFYKTESAIVDDRSRVFLRDLYEHTIQIMDTIESYRDVLNGLQDLLITEVSFRMNKIMQLLTLISVIFIPLTFLAGIYGMNFDNIPELHYKYGYHILLGIMLVVAVVLLILFRRKKWL